MCSVLPDPQKVKPGNVYLYQNGSPKRELKDLVPMHYAKLEEEAARAFTISILVPEIDRPNAIRRFKEISDCFFETSQDYFKAQAVD